MGTPLGDVEVTYQSHKGATTEIVFGASAFKVPGGTSLIVAVLDDGSVCTFKPGTALRDLKVGNHTVGITDNGVEDAARRAAAALAKMVGPKRVPGCFGIDSDSGDAIMIYPGPPTVSGYKSLVDGVKKAAASIHEENGGPPVTVDVSQHEGYTCFTFKAADRANYCVFEQPREQSGPGYVVVGGNLATGLKEAMKRVRDWIASTMCRAVGAWALPLMTKFEQKPDLRGIVWSEPGDTVTLLGSAGEKTFTVSDTAMFRGVAVPGLANPKEDGPGLDGLGGRIDKNSGARLDSSVCASYYPPREAKAAPKRPGGDAKADGAVSPAKRPRA